MKTDRRNNAELKNNLKTVVDKGNLRVYDQYLLEEMRLFEDKKGKESIKHDQYEGTSHFDIVAALKFASWMLSDRNRMADVLAITPLLETGKTREQQYLEAVLAANSARTGREAFRNQLQKENMEELKSGNEVPLKYDEVKMEDMGDITSMWTPFRGFTRKR